MRRAKLYKRVVDNKMKWQGVTDPNKRIIKVNKKRSKKSQTVIDTIYHEELHAAHPKMSEKEVKHKTASVLKRLKAREKKKYYSAYT